MGLFFEEKQFDDPHLLVGQLGHRLAHVFFRLGGRKLRFRSQCDDARIFIVALTFALACLAALLAPQRIDAQITRDREDPRRSAVAAGHKQVGFAPNGEHRFLGYFFGHRLAGAGAAYESFHAGSKMLEQGNEGRAIPLGCDRLY